MNKKIVIITIITIAILALGGGAFLYLNKSNVESNLPVVDDKKENNQEEDVVKEENNQEVLKKVGTDENDWNIYQSEKYGFEVRMPENWDIGRYGKDVYYGQYIDFNYVNNKLSNDNDFGIYIIDNYQKIIVNKKEDFLNYDKVYEGSLQSFEIIHNSNYIIIKTKEETGVGNVFSIIYYIFSDKYIYSFLIDDQASDRQKNVFFQIVKTFKTEKN